MRIAVYTIAKNEQAFVERWANSAKDADYLVIADTGSTDATEEKVAEYNNKNGNRIMFNKININPWRFDKARNESLRLVPADTDVCICLDMDEILTPNWRQEIESLWTPKITNRMGYNFIWNFDANGQPGLQFQSEKIHDRHSHKWVNAVHEILQPFNHEKRVSTNKTLIEHHADNSKSRSSYLPLLELDVAENPDNDRNSHYLGREYFLYNRFDEAIIELQRHLALPKAVWKSERCCSMRYIAKSYDRMEQLHGTNYFQNIVDWYNRACNEDINSKEARIDLATYYLKKNLFDEAAGMAQHALNIRTEESSYLRENYAQKEGPYDILSVAYYHTANYSEAVHYARKALELNPFDSRLHDNLRYALAKIDSND